MPETRCEKTKSGGGGRDKIGKRRKLVFEPLEERQMLSITPLGVDDSLITYTPTDAAPISIESPLAATLQEETRGIENTIAPMAMMAQGSGGSNARTFRTDSGEGLDNYTSGSISFTINIDDDVDETTTATLTLRVWDVDYNTLSDPNENERDMVSVNGQELGYLTGANDSWSICTFTISNTTSQPILKTGANTVHIDIDTLRTGRWAVKCDWGEIRLSTDCQIESITVENAQDSQQLPITTKPVKFTVKLSDNLPDGVTIKRVDMLIMGGQNNEECVYQYEPGEFSFNNNELILTYDPEEGSHGEKTLHCTVTLTDSSSKDVEISLSGNFKLFFDHDKMTNNVPNWLYYWAKDGAVPGLTVSNNGFKYNDTTVVFVKGADFYGGYSLESSRIGVSEKACGSVNTTTDISINGSSISIKTESAEGIYTLGHVLIHEYQHHLNYQKWDKNNDDEDWSISMHTRQKLASRYKYEVMTEKEKDFLKKNILALQSIEPIYNIPNQDHYIDNEIISTNDQIKTWHILTDTWDIARIFDSSYHKNGDNELQSRYAEHRSTVNEKKDWSDEGFQIENMKVQIIQNNKCKNVVSNAAFAVSLAESVPLLANSAPPVSYITVKNNLPNTNEPDGISDTITESPVDDNNDGYYESILLQTTATVQTAGDYLVAFDVFDSNSNYLMTYEETVALQAGTSQIEISIPGHELTSMVDGVLHVYLYLFDANDNYIGDNDPYLQTRSYSGSDFTPMFLFSDITETANDTDNNGLYNELSFTYNVAVAAPDDYVYSAYLYDANDNVIDEVSNSITFNTNTSAFSVDFDGLSIFQNQVDGPYRLHVSFLGSLSREVVYSQDIHVTGDYLYTAFEGAQAGFSGTISHTEVDTDANGKTDALSFDVGVNVSVAGEYTVVGYLKDSDGNSCGYESTTLSLGVGAKNFTLDFDSVNFLSFAKPGTFTLSSLFLLDETNGLTLQILSDAYTTPVIGTLDLTPIQFADTFQSKAYDDNNNQLYERLELTISYTANEAGNYLLSGSIIDASGADIYQIYRTVECLTAGDGTETVNIDGLDIYDGMFDGPYKIVGLMFSANGEVVTYGPTYQTDAYVYTDFEHRTLSLEGEITDSVNESMTSLDVTFSAISENGGYYNANARIVDNAGNTICWTAKNIMLEANTATPVTLSFDYAEIIEHGVSGPYYICDFSMYNNNTGTEVDSIFITDFHETAAYSIVLNVPEWNLADYNYANYKLDAQTAANYTATLYGREKDGTWTNLKAWDFIGAGATATITGQTKVAENLFITGSAMELLGEINFNGGDGQKDSVTIEGTVGDDLFELDTEYVVTTTPIETENPYTKLLEFYKSRYGETSKIYQKLKATYDNAFQKLQKRFHTTKLSYDLVSLAGGAAVKLAGVRIDLGSRSAQRVFSDSSATLRLNDDFESLVGSNYADKITSGSYGAFIDGWGGKDSVLLNGGDNSVALNGSGQSVTVRGDGENRIRIFNGDNSIVNAFSTGADSELYLYMGGQNVSFCGGQGTLNGTIVGDNAVVKAERAAQVILEVYGDNGSIRTGQGDDDVRYMGNNGSIRTDGGDDWICYTGEGGEIYGGNGNDLIILEDNYNWVDDSYVVAQNNKVYGENGDDFLFALYASGGNKFYAGKGNDIVIGGTGDDFIYGMSGNNILIGLDGADRVYGGTGRDILMASRSSNLLDLEDWNDDELDEFFADLTQAWMDEDWEATINLLGDSSSPDGSKDYVYRGGGKRNLFYVNKGQHDLDVENALTTRPFGDILFDE